ncbi:MAG: cytochrome c [Gemmatimonadales bacterium]
MASVTRWLVRILAGLFGVIVAAVGTLYVVSGRHFSKQYDITPEAVAIPTDSASIVYGEHIAATRGCTGCHRPNLAGGTFIDSPVFARLWARNLTPGKGGAGATYSDADWVRSIRHGIRPDGKPLLFMPSQEFNQLSDHDLGALIAWLKTRAPVDTAYPASSVGPIGRMIFLTGKLPLVPAELINHTAPRPADLPIGETLAYGKYLAGACVGCHGAGFSGGAIPGAPPEMLPARNVTPDNVSGIGKWSLEDFRTVLRSGRLPDGVQLDTLSMPVASTKHFTDLESAAMFAYFKSLPAKAYGNR